LRRVLTSTKVRGKAWVLTCWSPFFSDIDSLKLYAGVHRKVFGYHPLLSQRFPYAVYYSVEVEVIYVRAVLDCRRDPAWLRARLKQPVQRSVVPFQHVRPSAFGLVISAFCFPNFCVARQRTPKSPKHGEAAFCRPSVSLAYITRPSGGWRRPREDQSYPR